MIRLPSTRIAALAVFVTLACTGAALANYHFVHYTTQSAPFGIAREKFDLNALPNRTLYYFVTGAGPEKLADGDSFAAILSQIRLAAGAWNDVETSELRLEFGGSSASGTVQSNPGIDVLFEELPPGLVAMGGPTSVSTVVQGGGAAYVPIRRSVLVLSEDLSQRPSYGDDFFLTAVHELGHALGLQHTFTSSVMSTQTTRSTVRAAPLAADDVAGISLLYPTAEFSTRTGRISGRVLRDGLGVHLASVVAIDPSGSAVSALADPEGYYEITGLPPGYYHLYVHPLPPSVQSQLGPGDIVLPVDPDGKPVQSGPLFETVFYPDTRIVRQASIIAVEAGKSRQGFDFNVRPSDSLTTHGVVTYSFPGPYAVKPAFLNANGGRNYLLALGPGLVSDNKPAPGLKVEVVSGAATVLDDRVAAYVPPAPFPAYLMVPFSFSPFGSMGPRHLVFTLNSGIFVMPAAFHMVRSQPPSVASVTPVTGEDGRKTAVLSGSNLTASSRVLFDGIPAPVAGFDWSTGNLTVLVPQGASDHRAVVTALDTDRQSSMFLDALNPPTYLYGAAQTPALALSPGALSAGTEAMIEVSGTNTNFAEGGTVLGFGSSDVVVRRVWVLSPDRLLANVHVSAAARPGALALSAVTGFESATLSGAVVIQGGAPGAPVPDPTLINPATGQPSIYAGGKALLTVANLPANAASTASITVDGLAAAIESADGGRILFTVPSTLGLGPAILRLSLVASPIVVVIDPHPPVIQAATGIGQAPLTPAQPARPGTDLFLTVAGLADAAVATNPSLARVLIGSVVHAPAQITLLGAGTDVYLVRVRLSPSVADGAAVPVTIGIGYRISQPVPIPVAAGK